MHSIACAVLLLAAAAHPPALSERIDERVGAYANAGLFSGVVLVANRDGVIYEHAFGLADRAFDVPNSTATRFHIASVSKPITATAILMLADRGMLSLDDRISKYVPDFPNGDRITIEEVLTHYSGLGDTSGMPDFKDWSRFPQTTRMLVDRLAKLPLRSEPGTKYSYSNANYHLLAYIIEKVSGQSYGDFLQQNIFDPLGMTETAHHGDEKAVVPRLATGYMPTTIEGVEKPAYFDWTAKTGNGSLYTTAGDLLKFDRGFQRLLKPETVERAYGFHNPDRGVGMFWFHDDVGGHRAVYINGSSPGFKAWFERFVDDGVVVIILSNLYLASPNVMGEDIAAILWKNGAGLGEVPKRVARSRQDLDRAAGDYQFGPDFYTPNIRWHVERREDYLVMPNPLIPLADGSYIDRMYWSFIRFEDGKLVYRNGTSVFTAVKVK